MPSRIFMNNITALDYAFWDSTVGLLKGESLHVAVELVGELDRQGFVFDFGPAKKKLKALVDNSLDHCFLVPERHSTVKNSAAGILELGADHAYRFPAQATVLLPVETITHAALESYLAALARPLLPDNVTEVRFRLSEDPRFMADEPNFRYTHGLRYHDGNCQRLIHGHRNPVEVWMDGARNREWENFLAKEWYRVHFAAASTVTNPESAPRRRRDLTARGHAEIAYESPQGRFWARLPASDVVVLDNEPSIENIAALGAEILREQGVRDCTVVAYEGLAKGATATLEASSLR